MVQLRKAISDAGVKIASQRLRPTSDRDHRARPERQNPGAQRPYAEVKEQLGASISSTRPISITAISWAARCPGAQHGAIRSAADPPAMPTAEGGEAGQRP